MPKKILIIAPHADDEVLGVGGYMLREVEEGSEITVVIMAIGEYIDYNGLKCNPEKKKIEVDVCHQYLGVKRTIVYTDQESKLDTIPESHIVKFLDFIIKDGFDEIFLPYPSRHVDHKVTFNAGMAALRLREGKKPEKRVFLYEYPFINGLDNIDGGCVYCSLTNEQLEDKIEAFSFYKSQIKEFPSPLNANGITTLAKMRGMEAGLHLAEKFYLQRMII